MPDWAGHFADDTPLMHCLKAPFMYPEPEAHPDEISTARLLLVGILLCKGNARLRAECFWNVIQDGDQDFLSAADKDFFPAFQDMIEIGIIALKDFAKR